jgi:hypothetical protein
MESKDRQEERGATKQSKVQKRQKKGEEEIKERMM